VPPVLFGGHRDASLRRAATLGDGWIAGPLRSFDELHGYIRRLRELRDEAGRSWEGFEVHASPPPDALDRAAYRRLEEFGVTDACTLPINAGGELHIDAATRQRLTGRPVHAAQDPSSFYDTEPPATKMDAIRRFAQEIIAKR
jgi:alkanesulfonate monooxygenase SsuD/methylene tetrahydromethanopterin reductase-like flavin-dependent oxidoreductase (luciferase family)